jgi:hypothetical protein
VLDYRLYMLDARGGITRALEMRAQSDEAAVTRALESDHPFGMELWEGGRLVRAFLSDGQQFKA